ncbi:hypothetical protein T552_01245 [Pneumocystis carinii B80]|uniref:Cell division control protein 73 C-terminal domain-containing protein n=1 Tax=Pneumocystis carinii (strain B80) TaxID=1408658 RepID=A0A0W4ZLN2_PNEC8|nr:hypothetical protein T552_01245 [Pneumocystis carinii B80]KTW29290.1 hypothetical protein T552_01245 [Pneumocystis carinii B80]
MASTSNVSTKDPLILLKMSILESDPPKFLKTEDMNSVVAGLEEAEYLGFSNGVIVSLKEKTRFIRKETGEPFNLLSVFFAWQLKDANVAEYIQRCGESDVKNLSFLEKTDLVTWLDGAPESEHIQPLEEEKLSVLTSIQRRGGFERPERNPVLLNIYAQERIVGSRHTVLRGLKPIDFSAVRKYAYEHFISKLRNKQSGNAATLPLGKELKVKHRDPIILLSPSASSLLTMYNIKRFLEEGVFVPPEEALQINGGNRVSELIAISHTSRIAKGLSYRFVIVQGVDKFRPDYWDRVVCVFTTGQAWQFKEYKWSEPRELFHHVKGFIIQYVGDPPHPATKEWNVETLRIERFRRHTDREVVSRLWESLERWMDNHPVWRTMGRRKTYG